MQRFVGEEIYRIIPNQPPLMILDSLCVETGVKASGYKELKPDDWFFEYHYPGFPVLPATLLVENMTQVFISTFLSEREDMCPQEDKCLQRRCVWKTEEIPLLIRMGEIKVKESVRPGDCVRLDAYLHSFRRGIAKGKCEAYKLLEGGERLVMEFDVVHAVPQKMVTVHTEGHK